jgi:hypothetical protein
MTELKENEYKTAIAQKLNPGRFPNVSGKMIAILGALLNQKWTNPRISSIIASSDGFLLARPEGSVGFDEFIGPFSDFQRNLWGMVESAGDLTVEEQEFLRVLLKRVESGEESSTGETATRLSIDAIKGSSN